jgi:hypothetical protein
MPVSGGLTVDSIRSPNSPFEVLIPSSARNPKYYVTRSTFVPITRSIVPIKSTHSLSLHPANSTPFASRVGHRSHAQAVRGDTSVELRLTGTRCTSGIVGSTPIEGAGAESRFRGTIGFAAEAHP